MPDPLASAPTPQGTVPVGQRFELLGRIGAGNHGVVFRARDGQLQREVAIKRFSHFLADDPRAMRRITREVATLARVSHPNVVTVHDLVHMPDGDGEITPHLVMELVEGTSLRDLLATRGPSMRSVVAVRGVLEGLAACHHAGILHLDIKPANVLVTPRGGIRIVDFGIARAASDTTATVAGTPHYMAPEQFDGRADERSDIYSVGCLLYECLTGAPPFEGTMAAQVMAHRNKPRPDPRELAPDVTPALAAVVQRAMAIDPSARYQSVGEMLSALATVELGALSTASRSEPSVPHPVERTAGPRVTRVDRLQAYAVGFALSAFIVALLPGLVWSTTLFVPEAQRPPAMRDPNATAWWLLAVAIAGVFLLMRRQVFLASIGGPAVGQPQPPRVVDPMMRSGLRLAASAALRGSLPMLFPWYVLLVSGFAEAGGVPWPDNLFDSTWGLAWVLMPAAVVVLVMRGVTRLRLRFGSLLMAMMHLGGAGLAAVLFVAYPFAI
ncbi:serine/threonine-protein kinase [Aeromicrobium sp. NPDC092404]|uniref:serine/threonine-protein kinase n=1 Tax=Aeromicrobium sp. NPDC092404 TaxID=3154976 RepID=UPI003430237C